jgi:hypothetical protein
MKVVSSRSLVGGHRWKSVAEAVLAVVAALVALGGVVVSLGGSDWGLLIMVAGFILLNRAALLSRLDR